MTDAATEARAREVLAKQAEKDGWTKQAEWLRAGCPDWGREWRNEKREVDEQISAMLAFVATERDASTAGEVERGMHAAMAADLPGYGPLIPATASGKRPRWLDQHEVVARHLPMGLSERKARDVTTWDHPFRVRADHPFYARTTATDDAAEVGRLRKALREITRRHDLSCFVEAKRIARAALSSHSVERVEEEGTNDR